LGFFESEERREIKFSKEKKHIIRRAQKKMCHVTKAMVAVTE
jgi:hypothetical protein